MDLLDENHWIRFGTSRIPLDTMVRSEIVYKNGVPQIK